MKVNIDYQRTEQEAKANTNQYLTRDYIEFAISAKYQKLEGQKLRIFGRIQRKLDEAVEKNLETVDFEAAEMDMIREACKDAGFPPKVSKFVSVLLDEVDKA